MLAAMPAQGSAAAELAGRVAVVTGASRGIGEAVARCLVDAGARVALLARGRERLERVAAGLGAQALAVPTDVADAGSVRAAFVTVARELGGLDLLVNNAAIGRLHSIENASDEDLRATVYTNLAGPLLCSREAVPLMKKSGGGQIVNIGSEAVLNPFPLLSTYTATKAGLELFTRGLRAELRGDNIRVTLLRSGATDGGFMEDWDPAEAARAIELWDEQGYLAFSGAPMQPSTVAESLLHAVTRPAGASVDTLELRSAG
jgi:NADP-dependent 3-hydroxy acid dehydrogenase YdfG